MGLRDQLSHLIRQARDHVRAGHHHDAEQQRTDLSLTRHTDGGRRGGPGEAPPPIHIQEAMLADLRDTGRETLQGLSTLREIVLAQSRALDQARERLGAIERAQTPHEQIDHLSGVVAALGERADALAEHTSAAAQDAQRSIEPLREELERIAAETADAHARLGDTAASVDRLGEATRAAGAQHAALAKDLSAMLERSGGAEARLVDIRRAQDEAAQGMAGIYDAQQAARSAVEQLTLQTDAAEDRLEQTLRRTRNAMFAMTVAAVVFSMIALAVALATMAGS